MGLFSKKKNESNEKIANGPVHDPILSAVTEAQPYEVGNQEQTQALSPSGALRDIFGAPITNPDISNPARNREERPLDTMRAFEYAATGDESLRQMQESHTLGFRPRHDFNSMPQFDRNPYANDQVVHSFGDPNANPEEPAREVYYPPPGTGAKAQKKKGLFGRKKDQ